MPLSIVLQSFSFYLRDHLPRQHDQGVFYFLNIDIYHVHWFAIVTGDYSFCSLSTDGVFSRGITSGTLAASSPTFSKPTLR